MQKNLDDALCSKYPLIFRDRHGDPRKTAMVWGFACDDGWYTILDTLCAQLMAIYDEAKKLNAYSPPPIATQVKEKFGVLCFYYDAGDDMYRYWPVVRFAEALSAVTCEKCGKTPAKRRGNGWIHTSCDGCEATYGDQ
jgi:hypothetical protein